MNTNQRLNIDTHQAPINVTCMQDQQSEQPKLLTKNITTSNKVAKKKKGATKPTATQAITGIAG